MLKQNSLPKKTSGCKSKRRRVLEISFICSLLLLSALFYSFKKFDNTGEIIIPKPPPLIVDNIPITKPPQKIIRPETYRFPVESDDPGISDDVTIDYGDIDIGELISNSGPPEDDIEEGIPYHWASEKPVLIKSVEPVYPELARKAGIEGNVVTKVLIDKKGNIEIAEILKSVPMLDNAALEAVKEFQFKPGKQGDKYVKIWMAIPFKFKLK